MNDLISTAKVSYETCPTPTPWDYVPSTEHHGPYITSNYGGTIADLYTMTHPFEASTANGGRSKPVSFFHEMADPNAKLIVKAVNSHDALVAALRRSREAVNAIVLSTHSVSFDADLRAIDAALRLADAP